MPSINVPIYELHAGLKADGGDRFGCPPLYYAALLGSKDACDVGWKRD